MTDVVTALTDLRDAIVWPSDDADLTGRAVARIGARRPARRGWPAVAIAAVVGVGAGVPAAAHFLSLGGVRIELTGAVPDTLGTELELGRPTELREDALRPPSLGAPAAAFEGRPAGGYTEVWPGPVLVTSFPGSVDREMIGKQAASVQTVTVDGAPGFWIEGRHAFLYYDDDGNVVEDTMRLSGSALVWTRGEVTYRIEAPDLTFDETLALAESMS